MARHRSPSGAQDGNFGTMAPLRVVDIPGVGRLPPPPCASTCGRATLAAVAAGALVAAGQSMIPSSLAAASPREVSAFLPVAQTTAPTVDPAAAAIGADQLTAGVQAVDGLDPASAVDVASLAKATQIGLRQAQQTSLVGLAEASGAIDANVVDGHAYVRPAIGLFTSGFGARWGTFHYGVDIANAIGTPIYAVTDAVVEDAGPASGFGLWVVLRHADGSHSVYGHVNRMFVQVGQTVMAGQEIAEIGNRGDSTGPHLHFEVWAPDGTKINPMPWLLAHGINIL